MAGLIFGRESKGLTKPAFTSQLYDKYPGGIRERSPQVEVEERRRVTSGQERRPYLLSCTVAPITPPPQNLVDGAEVAGADFVASGIATVLLYVVRVNR
jgi:hypothetical protein